MIVFCSNKISFYIDVLLPSLVLPPPKHTYYSNHLLSIATSVYVNLPLIVRPARM